MDCIGSSPHTRGARANEPGHRRRQRIIPAYAGSTSIPGMKWLSGRDHPRIRGEHMPWGDSGGQHPGSSPHTRGALRQVGLGGAGRGIIPAYAGSTSSPTPSSKTSMDHPRIRGEHGAGRLDPDRSGGIIPAYAGSTSKTTQNSSPRPDHPRIRGEHASVAKRMSPVLGSSPHTRGAPPRGRRRHLRCRIIPAYAGSTRVRDGGLMAAEDHPRIRGEHSGLAAIGKRAAGSSPHTRGALAFGDHVSVGPGIIPAYAGSTIRPPSRTRHPGDHPRIRGEHRPRGFRSAPGPGSSPHTRGARRL